MGEIKKQSINNSLISYFGAAVGMFSIYLMPQLISASDIGLMRLLFSFSWMAAVLMPLGIGSITLRYFPKIKNDANGHHGLFALLFLISSIGALIIGLILFYNTDNFTGLYSKSPEFPKYFNEAIVFAYILSLISVYTLYAASLFKTTFTVFLTDVFTRIGQLVVVIIYYYGLINQAQLIWLYIFVFLLQLLLLLVHLWRAKAISFRIKPQFYKQLPLKEIALFGALMMVTAFASLGIKYIDQLMIGYFKGTNMVGIYATCVMMSVVMEIPFNSLERIAAPKISYAWSINDQQEVAKIYEMSSRYMYFAGAVLFSLLVWGIDFILTLLPPEYAAGKWAFYFVTLSSLLNLLTGVNSSVILYSHKYFAASVFLFVLIGVGALANFILIPLYGISGAGIATLLAIGTYNTLKYLYILLRFKMQPLGKFTGYITVALVIALLPCFLLPSSITPFVKALIGGSFTLLIFSILNIKLEVVHEVNKLFKRIGLLR